MLPINEVFETIQGEAHYTGTPAVFVRLQGCDVGCPWCDTKHTWDVAPGEAVTTSEMLAKLVDGKSYAMMEATAIAAHVASFKARHVVITGGEPCLYDLRRLTELVIAGGRTVQIETSGTEEIHAHPETWITVSPKVNMPGGKPILMRAIALANEIKMPVGKAEDIDRLERVLAMVPGFRPMNVWLQPLSQSNKATDLCVKSATELGFRLSLQTHKFLGVR